MLSIVSLLCVEYLRFGSGLAIGLRSVNSVVHDVITHFLLVSS